MTLPAFRQELKGAPGAKIKVKLASGQERVLTLRELI